VPSLIKVGARSSRLSRAQVNELQEAVKGVALLDPIFFETRGDLDLATSLRSLGKSNFFTKEIDEALLRGECRVALHSAKDLPEPLPDGLMVVALTCGVDPKDVIVYNEPLKRDARIGTSSEQREKRVRAIFPDAHCVDIRGTIEQRLKLVDSGLVDGLVVAEAALLRLKLERKRMDLPGAHTPLQGQLAVVARFGDLEMEALFSCLDVRRRYLYLGTDPSHFVYPNDLKSREFDKVADTREGPVDLRSEKQVSHSEPEAPQILSVEADAEVAKLKKFSDGGGTKFGGCPTMPKLGISSGKVVHYPVIRTVARPIDLDLMPFTHIIFTSKNAVDHFLAQKGLQTEQKCIAIGQVTAEALTLHGITPWKIAEVETQEGVIELLMQENLQESRLLLPRSALARSALTDYLDQARIRYVALDLYDTLFQAPTPIPDLATIDAIVFTSPSTVDAFLQIYSQIPSDKEIIAQGPITQARLSGNGFLESTCIK